MTRKNLLITSHWTLHEQNICFYFANPSNLQVSAMIFQRRQWHPTPVTFAYKILWTEEPGRLQSMGLLESDTTERLHFHFSLSCIGEGNGNPLQCSCLENPRDGGAWWAAVYGVTQSWTRLKRLSSSSSRAIICRFFICCCCRWYQFLSSPCFKISNTFALLRVPNVIFQFLISEKYF